jgi:hypothetical protein
MVLMALYSKAKFQSLIGIQGDFNTYWRFSEAPKIEFQSLIGIQVDFNSCNQPGEAHGYEFQSLIRIQVDFNSSNSVLSFNRGSFNP